MSLYCYLFCHLPLDIWPTPYKCINYLPLLLEEAVARRCSANKVLLNILKTLQENTCARVFYSKKLQAWPATLSKKRLWNKCFPVNFAIFLRIPFFVGHHWWLLFYFVMGVCTIVPEENCPPGRVRIRLGGLGLALGVISLGRICPRTLVK